jgi:integrase
MPLSDTAIKAAKPAASDYKLFDEKGLFLLVTRGGGKLWRFKYRFVGKEQLLVLGKYPDVGLKEARARRDAARKALADGQNPAVEKKKAAVAAAISAANTFKAVAKELIDKGEREGRAPPTLAKARWFLSLLEPGIGSRPIAEIEAYELLGVLKPIEAAGHHETASRMLAFAGRVFRYGVATTRCRSNPAADLRGALISPKVKHHAAILDPEALGGLLRAIDGFQGQPATKLALRLSPHVFVRPGELRRAEWSELDLKSAIWRIPGVRMKMRREHVVPLSRQAVGILKEAKLLSGSARYVFPSIRSLHRPMSENTINAALRRLGYGADEMTGHGFRSTASTLLNESGIWNSDAIERALAHKDSDQVRAAYHRGAHWDERIRMSQWWSDFLDKLKTVKQASGRPAATCA